MSVKELVEAKLRCVNCGKIVKEVCPDGYCRDCHVSLSFEDCCDGTWSARMMKRTGWPKEKIKE